MPKQEVHVRRVQRHMNTSFDLVVSCERRRILAAEQVLGEAHRRIAVLERELSEFIPESPIARLNAAGVGARVELPPSAMELLDRSEVLRIATGGAFDCTVKSRLAGFPRVEWSLEEGQAWRCAELVHVGFGAIGKGYALDRIREDLEREGFHDYCLTAGGSSIVLSGFSAEDEPWRWAWSWEKGSDGEPRGISLSHPSGIPVALGVSGLHEQGAHLKDPGTGLAVTRARSSLIGHPRATEADALSTALFVSGWEKAGAYLGSLPDRPAMALVDEEGVPRWNGIFQSLWGAPWQAACVFFALFFSFVSRADDTVDLSQMGLDDFTPYLFERNRLWILLPLLSLLFVLLHLKQKPKPKRIRQPLPERNQ